MSMCSLLRCKTVLVTITLVFPVVIYAAGPSLGTPLDDAAVATLDISISPSGDNLPEGSGSVAAGKTVYDTQCVSCHGADGAGGEKMADPLVGGVGSLATDSPMKTVGSYWPYATTLFDYVRRAMPLNAPLSLTDDEVYAVSAYILSLNGIVEKDAVMDATTLTNVKMPNQAGFNSQWPTHTH